MNFKVTEIGELPLEWDVDTMENALDEIIDYRGKTPAKRSKPRKSFALHSDYFPDNMLVSLTCSVHGKPGRAKVVSCG